MERRGYEGVIATITTECERLQASVASAEEALAAARAKVARWKSRSAFVFVCGWLDWGGRSVGSIHLINGHQLIDQTCSFIQ